MVVKVYMWPGGDKDNERLLSQATFDLQGQAYYGVASEGIRKGERAYRVRLLKDTSFGGPEDDTDVRPSAIPDQQVWREGTVRGHMPGARGTWDLIGGALKILLGRRLGPYVPFDSKG